MIKAEIQKLADATGLDFKAAQDLLKKAVELVKEKGWVEPPLGLLAKKRQAQVIQDYLDKLAAKAGKEPIQLYPPSYWKAYEREGLRELRAILRKPKRARLKRV